MQIPTDKIQFNQVHDRSSKEWNSPQFENLYKW